MERESFVFYKDWREMVKSQPSEIRGAMYAAIIDYALADETPKDPYLAIAFTLVKQQIDRDRAKWEETRKARSEAGRKGNEVRWGAKQNIANIANATNLSQNVANVAVNVNDNVNVNEDIKKENNKRKKEAYEAADANTEYGKFLRWIYNNCTHLLSMDVITEEEFTRLRTKYVGEDFKKVWAMLERMENYKDTAKKNRNMYRTLLNWLKREE